LKVRDRDAAVAARNLVELTLQRLKTGLVRIPAGVDPADFIVSGGVLTEPVRTKPAAAATPERLVAAFLEARRLTLAPSTHDLFRYHLRRWIRHLREDAARAIDRVTHASLDDYLRLRIVETSGTTAAKERRTLSLFFDWAVRSGTLAVSPAAGLPVIREDGETHPFRSMQEVLARLERGGLSDEEERDAWECLYLNPAEIAGLLALAGERAGEPESMLLYAIPPGLHRPTPACDEARFCDWPGGTSISTAG
jgi:hypothetical protein